MHHVNHLDWSGRLGRRPSSVRRCPASHRAVKDPAMARAVIFDTDKPENSLNILDAAISDASGRLYVLYAGAAAQSCNTKILHWITMSFDRIARQHPRLDLVPVPQYMGWISGSWQIPELTKIIAAPEAAQVARQFISVSGAQQSAAAVTPELDMRQTTESVPGSVDLGLSDAHLKVQLLQSPAISSPPAVEGGQDAVGQPAGTGQHSTAAAGQSDKAAAGRHGTAVPAFCNVVLGGTFDRLHAGHRLLLAVTALAATQSVHVGITDAAMIASKKKRELLETYTQRSSQVVEYLHAINPNLAVQTVPLLDAKLATHPSHELLHRTDMLQEATPASLLPDLQAIVVSQETVPGAHAINEDRRQRGFPPLAILVVGLVGLRKGASAAEKLSSTYLREIGD